MTLTRNPSTTSNDVALVWLEQSTHPADVAIYHDGWVTHMVEARADDQVVGYLRISYVTKESSFAAAPDSLHFMATNRGWCLSFEDPADLWCRAHLYAGKTPLSLRHLDQPPAPWALSPHDAPASDVIESDLAVLQRDAERERRTWLARTAVPIVAFVRVDDGEKTGTNWRRRGIARDMYLMVAKELGRRGLCVMASSLQGPEAVRLWDSFERDPATVTRRITPPGSRSTKRTCLVLDYRK